MSLCKIREWLFRIKCYHVAVRCFDGYTRDEYYYEYSKALAQFNSYCKAEGVRTCTLSATYKNPKKPADVYLAMLR